MTKNLLNLVSDQFSDGMITKISSMIGENTGTTKSAVSSALPTILKGIINRGDTEQNVASLKKFISDEKIGSDSITELSTVDYLSKGSSAVDFLMGSAKNTLLGNAAKRTGLSVASNSKLMSAIAPMALSYISKMASSEKLTDRQLANYLDGQKNKLITLASSKETATRTSENVASTKNTASTQTSGGGGFLKWLLPLLLLLAVLWWFMNKDKGEAVNETVTTEVEGTIGAASTASTTLTNTARSDSDAANSSNTSSSTTSSNQGEGSVNSSSSSTSNSAAVDATNAGLEKAQSSGSSSSSGFSINSEGNLLDGNGKLIAKAGEFSEVDGHYVDASGKKLGLLKKVGQAIGGAATKTADAVAGAAVKSAEKVKEVFTGLFKSKEKVGSTYEMSKIVFDEKSHRITDFSKGEVEGLAAALKAMPKAKVQVQVHGDADKSITGKRAEVVKAMLVTLGVDKKQISSKGMGNGDTAKAAAGKVEIKVEQTVD